MATKKQNVQPTLNLADAKTWFQQSRPIYESLAENVRGILENLLTTKNIDFLSVTCRAKDIDSFLDKLRKKAYPNFKKDIHDLAGIRVITYVESDVYKVEEIIKSAFKIHPEASLDKSSELGVDRIGYRSLHFVCDLGRNRCKLPEFSRYKGLPFEFQVRTVLEHAWAEIEHDRNYKFSGVLPSEIQRRLNLAAGTLEMVDREFNSLARDIDKYSEEVAKQAKAGNLTIELNSTSLNEYVQSKIFQAKGIKNKPTGTVSDETMQELLCFGIKRIADIDVLFSGAFITDINNADLDLSVTGLFRTVMLYQNITEYFDKAWDRHWTTMPQDVVGLLKSKYGNNMVETLLAKKKITTYEEKQSKKVLRNS